MSLSFDYVTKYSNVILGNGEGEVVVTVENGVVKNMGFYHISENPNSTNYYLPYNEDTKEWDGVVGFLNDNGITLT